MGVGHPEKIRLMQVDRGGRVSPYQQKIPALATRLLDP